MTRFLLPICAISSMLFMLAVVLVWVLSFSQAFASGVYVFGGRFQGFGALDGRAYFLLTDLPIDGVRSFTFDAMMLPADEGAAQLEKLQDQSTATSDRFKFTLHRNGDPQKGLPFILLGMPIGMLLLPASVAPYLFVRRWRRQRFRRRAGLCLSCGYDIRATPGRCPECGATYAALSTNLLELQQ